MCNRPLLAWANGNGPEQLGPGLHEFIGLAGKGPATPGDAFHPAEFSDLSKAPVEAAPGETGAGQEIVHLRLAVQKPGQDQGETGRMEPCQKRSKFGVPRCLRKKEMLARVDQNHNEVAPSNELACA